MKHASFVLVVLVATLRWPLYAQDVTTRLQRGLQLALRNSCEAALVDLNAVVAVDSRNKLALNAIGTCEARLGHPERATNSFRRVTEIAPSDWLAWSNLGANHLTLKQPELATAALQKALNLKSTEVSVWFNLGQALELQGKTQPAFRALDRAERLNTRDTHVTAAWQGLANKLATQAAEQVENKNYQAAKTLLWEVRRPLASSASWNNLLGYVEFKLGDRVPAFDHLQKAVHMEPDSEDFLLDLGEYLLTYHAHDAATRFFVEGLRRNPDSMRIQFGLAMVYQAEKRHEKAIALFNKLVMSHPTFEPAYSAMGRSLERTLQWQEIINLGKSLRARNESSAVAWHLIGAGLLGQAHDSGGLAEATSALQKSLRLNPTSSETHFLLAKAYDQSGRSSDAIDSLKQTLSLDPQHESAHYVLGQLYRKAGKSNLAYEQLKAHEKIRERKRDETVSLIVTESKTR